MDLQTKKIQLIRQKKILKITGFTMPEKSSTTLIHGNKSFLDTNGIKCP